MNTRGFRIFLVVIIVAILFASCYSVGSPDPNEVGGVPIGEIDSPDSGWVGIPGGTFTSSPKSPSGGQFIRVTHSGDIIFQNITLLLDLSEFENDGWLHLDVYVDRPDLVHHGQFEFASNGAPDTEEYHFGEFGANIPLVAGWNSLDLPFEDLVPQGSEANMSAINYIRVYFGVSGGTAMVGLSNMYVYHKAWPSKDPAYAAALAKAYADSLLHTGNPGNKAAIAAVLEKAQNGEPITLVTLGDSNTAGAGADGPGAWVSRVRKYLADTFPSSTVTLVNSGIGSTDGVFGVCRMDKDVLAYNPDLVFVDFGPADFWMQHGQEAYEGIVTNLLSRGIPMINLNVCPKDGTNIQELQLPVNQLYGVPQISFKSAFQENLASTANIKGLTAGDIWSFDNVHPSANGHYLISYLVTSYLQNEIIDAGIQSAPQDTVLPAPLTANRYFDAVLMENFDDVPDITVTLGGWTADYSARIYQLSTEGWQAAAFNSTLTFDVNCGVFEVFFTLAPAAGDLEIKVDGTPLSPINFAYQGSGYMNPYHVIHFDEPGAHTITLTLKKNPAVNAPWFGICAVGAAKF
jgi:lysophospholipase L1-like esterase